MVLFIIKEGDKLILQHLTIHKDLIAFMAIARFVFDQNVIHRFAKTII